MLNLQYERNSTYTYYNHYSRPPLYSVASAAVEPVKPVEPVVVTVVAVVVVAVVAVVVVVSGVTAVSTAVAESLVADTPVVVVEIDRAVAYVPSDVAPDVELVLQPVEPVAVARRSSYPVPAK